METLLQDLRYAMRSLLRSPGFTVIAVLALSLGIGANTAIFSVVDAVALKPLPYEKAEQLVQVWTRFRGIGLPNDRNWVSAPEFQDMQQNRSLSHLAAIQNATFNLTFGGVPERVQAARVSPSFFPMLGVKPTLGRAFLPEEGFAGKDRVALVSNGFWKRRLGGSPSAVGGNLIMNGQSYLVAGVLPPGFQLPLECEVWVPLSFQQADLSPDNRGNHGLLAIARTKPGVSYQQAAEDMDSVARRIVQENPQIPYATYNFGILLVPLLEQQVGDLRTALAILMGAVALVLVIACANVANLLLIRATAREHEIAIRQALGVSRWRLARQLLTESCLLSLTGGAAGVAIAWWTLRVLQNAASADFPRVSEAHLDPRVLGFTILVSLLTGLIFGMAPVVRAGHVAHDRLKEGRRGTAGGASQRLLGALVVAELAVSLTLMAGAGLLLRSFLRLQDVDGGFRPAGVLTMRVSLPPERYDTPEKAQRFYRELMDRLRRLPGVDKAGAVAGLPLSGSGISGTIQVDSTAVPVEQSTPEADQRPVTSGYFESMGIELVAGRLFDERDHAKSALAAVIDETMAATYWPKESALGKRLRPGGRDSRFPWFTVVGVVRHVRYRTLEAPSRVQFYFPYEQYPFVQSTLSLTVHTTADPMLLARSVAREVAAIDADQPVYRVRTMQELVDESLSRRRVSMVLLLVFAGLALVLSAMGIYGVMSYSVEQRAREVGIRMALGARSSDVMRMVLARSAGLTVAGILFGIAGSLALTRFLSTLLFGVKPTDPVTYLLGVALLALVALLACCVPTWRASTADPVSALREG